MTSRLAAPALLVVLLGGSLAACSGDGGGSPDASATVTETVTVTADPSESPSDGPSSSPPSDTPRVDLSKPPETYDEAIAHIDAALEINPAPEELSRFEAPSSNLYCVLDDEFIPPSCELAQGTIEDPEVCGDSPSTAVGRVEFGDGGPVPQCNTDTIRMPGAPVLGYGGVATWPGLTIQCVMEGLGVTCVDTETEQGFFLAKGRYLVF